MTSGGHSERKITSVGFTGSFTSQLQEVLVQERKNWEGGGGKLIAYARAHHSSL